MHRGMILWPKRSPYTWGACVPEARRKVFSESSKLLVGQPPRHGAGPPNALTLTAWYGMLKCSMRAAAGPPVDRVDVGGLLTRCAVGAELRQARQASSHHRSAHAMNTPMSEARMESLVAMSTRSPSERTPRPLRLALAICAA